LTIEPVGPVIEPDAFRKNVGCSFAGSKPDSFAWDR